VSEENLAKVKTAVATWDGLVLRPEDRPFERIFSLEAVTAIADADAVYESAVLPDQAGEAYRGVEAWARAAETWIEPCEWMVVDLVKVLDAGDRIVSLHRARMRMGETGIEFEMALAYVYTFRDGSIMHTRAFADHSEALKSVGLEA
jgi:ketosteroid isomerase-like protein